MSTTVSNDRRRPLIAQVHIACHQLGLDDDTYRQMLREVTGQSSCKDLDIAGLERVIAHCRRSGWRPEKRFSPKTRHQRPDTTTVVDKIRALWIDMHRRGIVTDGSEQALSAWVRRMTARRNRGAGIDHVGWLSRDPGAAQQVLEALKKWAQRTS